MLHTLSLGLHLLAAIVWVGGMFFAYVILRPVSGELEPPLRLVLWRGVFARFFRWVWISILVLLASGYAMLFGTYEGFAGAGVHIHVMHLLGWIMFLIFGHLYFALWRKFDRLVAAGQNSDAGQVMGKIRLVVAINLGLGLAVSLIGATGPYWP